MQDSGAILKILKVELNKGDAIARTWQQPLHMGKYFGHTVIDAEGALQVRSLLSSEVVLMAKFRGGVI